MSHDPFRWIPEALADLEREGLRRWRRVGAGRREKPLLNFGTNDYLALASDPRLVDAARRVAETHGWGAGASPAVCGRTAVHEELEERLAQFEGTEAAILFPSGFAANAGVIPTLVGKGDVIYGDAKNHASLIDGCRLARATRRVYSHGDTQALRPLLALDKGDGDLGNRRRLIVTDTLFSMDGDFAPLGKIARLAAEHGVMLLVDEAHATGVWGSQGRGVAEDVTTLDESSLIRVGTLSKALGASGGFVVGSRALIDWLANRARPYVFSTAPPAAMAAAAIAAIEIVQSEPERRKRVRALGDQLRTLLHADEWETGSSASQIVPIVLGDPETAVRLSDALLSAGIYVPAIRPPSVPAGESLLRVSLSASHTEEDLDRLVGALRTARPA